MGRVIGALSFLLMGACSLPDYQVTKPGMTYEQKMADQQACRIEAAKHTLPLVDPVIPCLRGKGYTFLSL